MVAGVVAGDPEVQSSNRVILHIDLDAFYAQVEVIRLGRDPSMPLCVQQWGGVIAVNYAAKALGITRHDTVEEVLKKCPDVELVHVETVGEAEPPPRSGTSDEAREGFTLELEAEDESALDAGVFRTEACNPDDKKMKVSLNRYRVASDAIFEALRSSLRGLCGRVGLLTTRGSKKGSSTTWIFEKASVDEVYMDVSELVLHLSQAYADCAAQHPSASTSERIAGEDGGVLQHVLGQCFDYVRGTPEQHVLGHQSTSALWYSDRALWWGGAIAKELREHVHTTLCYTCSAGIAHNKMIAKMCSAMHKPFQQTVTPADAVPELMHGTPIKKIRFLGGKLGQRLEAQKLHTAGDVQQVPWPQLLHLCHGDESTAQWVHSIVRGVDASPVTDRSKPKSMLAAKSMAAEASWDNIHRWVDVLCNELGDRLQHDSEKHHRTWKTLTVRFRTAKKRWPYTSRSAPLPVFAWGPCPDGGRAIVASKAALLIAGHTKAVLQRCAKQQELELPLIHLSVQLSNPAAVQAPGDQSADLRAYFTAARGPSAPSSAAACPGGPPSESPAPCPSALSVPTTSPPAVRTAPPTPPSQSTGPFAPLATADNRAATGAAAWRSALWEHSPAHRSTGPSGTPSGSVHAPTPEDTAVPRSAQRYDSLSSTAPRIPDHCRRPHGPGPGPHAHAAAAAPALELCHTHPGLGAPHASNPREDGARGALLQIPPVMSPASHSSPQPRPSLAPAAAGAVRSACSLLPHCTAPCPSAPSAPSPTPALPASRAPTAVATGSPKVAFSPVTPAPTSASVSTPVPIPPHDLKPPSSSLWDSDLALLRVPLTVSAAPAPAPARPSSGATSLLPVHTAVPPRASAPSPRQVRDGAAATPCAVRQNAGGSAAVGHTAVTAADQATPRPSRHGDSFAGATPQRTPLPTAAATATANATATVTANATANATATVTANAAAAATNRIPQLFKGVSPKSTKRGQQTLLNLRGGSMNSRSEEIRRGTSTTRNGAAGAIVACPICDMKVLSDHINHHLDLECNGTRGEVLPTDVDSAAGQCNYSVATLPSPGHKRKFEDGAEDQTRPLKQQQQQPLPSGTALLHGPDGPTRCLGADVCPKGWGASLVQSRPVPIQSKLLPSPLAAFEIPQVPGLYNFPMFLSAAEEQAILSGLDQDPRHLWRPSEFNGECLSKKWGVVTDLARRTVRPADPSRGEFEMPALLQPLVARFAEAQRPWHRLLHNFCPNESNSNDYQAARGHYLADHFDDRFLSGDILVGVSLSGECHMSFKNEKPPHQTVKVRLPRCSLQVVTGKARFEWTHGIQKSDLLDPRRVSVIFRQSKCPWPEPMQ